MSGTHFTAGNQTEAEKLAEKKELENTWNGKSKDKLIHKWLEIKEALNIFYPDIEIVSVNPVGLRGIFTDLFQNKEG